MKLDDLKTWFPHLQPPLLESLEGYATELLRFNKAINLVSVHTVDRLAKIHFADCILGTQILFKSLDKACPVYDLGSGNGFPGVVMGLMDPEQEVILVEKDQRKAEFLSHLVDFLKLPNVTVLNQPLEDLAEGSLVQAVSRAFAPLHKAMMLTRRYFRSHGRYYHFKSDTWSLEMASVPSQLFSEWQADHLGDYRIPETEKVHAILMTTKL